MSGGELRLALEPIADTAELARSWQALEAEAPGSFFLSWDWIGTWLATLPPALRPSLLRATRRGATVGLACMVVNTVRRRLIIPYRGLYLNATGDRRFDCITVEHNGFLCAAEDRPAMLAALGGWFAGNCLGAEELWLPGTDTLIPAPPLADAGLSQIVSPVPAFAVDLARVRAAGGDLGTLISRNARQQIRRAVRLYEPAGGAAVHEARSTAEALDFFAGLKDLHIASWQRRRRRHAFAEPYFERFHRALIEFAFERGGVQLLRIAAGGEPIGYLYNLRRGGRVYAYQSGFADSNRRWRPGFVSHWLAIGLNAARGECVYDFMAGENRLKKSFATDPYTLYWQTLRQPRLKYRIEDGVRAVKRRLLGRAPL